MNAHSIVVLGAGGFLGADVVRAALASGCAVHAVVRSRQRAWRLESVASPALTIHEMDATRADVVSRVATLRPTAIVHAAGSPTAGVASSQSDSHGADWLRMGTNVMDAARSCSARLVLIGSSAEYGPVEGVVEETATCRPVTPYGVAKHAVTVAALTLADAGDLDAIVLRPFILFGAGQDPDMFIPALARSLAVGTPFAMSPGLQRRDFVFVADAADAVVRAATAEHIPERVINVATGRGVTILDAAQRLAALFGRADLLLPGARPYRADDAMEHVGNPRRARALLQWVATTSLDNGLAIVKSDAERRWLRA